MDDVRESTAKRVVEYDAVININKDIDLEQKPKIHISRNGLNLSDEDTKSIRTDIEGMMSEALEKNRQLLIDKFNTSQDQLTDSKSKINIFLKGLGLQREVESDLLHKLTSYVKEKGLGEIEGLVDEGKRKDVE